MGLTLESEEGAFQAAHKKPLMCGLGVPVGCRMKHAKGLFKRPISLGCLFMPGWLRDGFDLGKRRRSLERQNLQTKPSGGKLTCPKHVIFMSKCLEVLTGGRSM